METINLAVFASGAGSNTEAIINHFKDHGQINVVLVVASKSDAGVIDVADRHHIECVILDKAAMQDEEMVLGVLNGFEIDYCILAGWLLLIPGFLVQAFEGRMLNIHPALLPKFGGKGMYGKHVHRAVAEAAEKESGITIHLVNEHYDEGGVIAQYKVALGQEEGADEIEKKVRALELAHYPKVIETFVTS